MVITTSVIFSKSAINIYQRSFIICPLFTYDSFNESAIDLEEIKRYKRLY